MRANDAGRGGAHLGFHRRLQPQLRPQVPQGQHRGVGRRDQGRNSIDKLKFQLTFQLCFN